MPRPRKPLQERIRKDEDGTFWIRLNLKHGDKRVRADSMDSCLKAAVEEISRDNLGLNLPRGSVGKMVLELIEDAQNDLTWPKDPVRFLREIEAWFGSSTQLTTLTESRLKKWKKAITKNPGRKGELLAAASINNRIAQMKKLLNRAHREGFIRTVPPLKKVKDFGERRYDLNRDVYLRIREALPKPPFPHRAMLDMVVFTGKRATDLLNTQRDEIRGEKIHFRSSKNGKLLSLRIPQFVRESLDELRDAQTGTRAADSPYLFAYPSGQRAGQPVKSVKTALATASAKIGLDYSVGLHMFRHFAADCWAKITKNPITVMKVIGWSSVDLVYRYTHLQKVEDEVFDQFDNLIKLGDPQADVVGGQAVAMAETPHASTQFQNLWAGRAVTAPPARHVDQVAMALDMLSPDIKGQIMALMGPNAQLFEPQTGAVLPFRKLG